VSGSAGCNDDDDDAGGILQGFAGKVDGMAQGVASTWDAIVSSMLASPPVTLVRIQFQGSNNTNGF
jgi:hypothetical protein